jgi:hypothetical protein
LRQRAALNVLGDNETGELVGAADIMYGDNVRVVEVSDGAGFDKVGLDVFGFGCSMTVRHLDRYRAVELIVVGKIDNAETALT